MSNRWGTTNNRSTASPGRPTTRAIWRIRISPRSTTTWSGSPRRRRREGSNPNLQTVYRQALLENPRLRQRRSRCGARARGRGQLSGSGGADAGHGGRRQRRYRLHPSRAGGLDGGPGRGSREGDARTAARGPGLAAHQGQEPSHDGAHPQAQGLTRGTVPGGNPRRRHGRADR